MEPTEPLQNDTPSAPRRGPALEPAWLWRGALLTGILLIAFPAIDLTVSGLFHDPIAEDPNQNFYFRQSPVLGGIHEAIQFAGIVMGVGLILGFLYCAVSFRTLAGVRSRGYLFLLLALLVGPGFFTNVVFKNNWDRARPNQIAEFGGRLRFTPPLMMADQCERNCSFVSGDAALGFFPHAFAYVAAHRRRRLVFLGGLGFGILVGAMRVVMGAHFLSDVLFAGALVVATAAAMHALVFGRAATAAFWDEVVFGRPPRAAR